MACCTTAISLIDPYTSSPSLPFPTVIPLACSQALLPHLMSCQLSSQGGIQDAPVLAGVSPIQRGWGKRAQYGQKHCAKGIEMTKKRQRSVADGLCSQGRHTFPQSQLGLKHLHRGWPGHTIQSKMGNISTGHLLTWPLEAPERWQISLLY